MMKTKMNGPNPHAAECCSDREVGNVTGPSHNPEISCALQALVKRHYCLITRKRRIHELAEPVRRRERFQPKCPCPFERKIDIEREEPVRTRTEQLALAPVRKLLLFKSAKKGQLDEVRLEIINRHLRKSLLSLYSHLGNAEPPQPYIPTPKWTKKQWAKHRTILKKLAKPKEPPKLPPIKKSGKPFGEMERYKELALPKEYVNNPKEEWTLTDNMKHYKPSKRILEISKPIPREDDQLPSERPVSEAAKTYKPSKRILELAVARDKLQVLSDLKENPFSIEPNALKYRATTRIKELAEPKEYDEIHTRGDITRISPAALNAKPTPRLIELAKPRERV